MPATCCRRPATTSGSRISPATGFLTLGAKVLAEQDVDKMVIDIVDEQVNVIGRAFLAEPIGCARCHDHKFDPIPTADYYALAGILRSTRTMVGENRVGRWVERPLADEETVARYEAAQERVEEAQEAVDDLVDAQNELLRRPRRQALAAYLLAAEEAYPAWGDDEAAQEQAAAEIARIAGRDGLEAGVVERWVRAFFRYREGPRYRATAPTRASSSRSGTPTRRRRRNATRRSPTSCGR